MNSPNLVKHKYILIIDTATYESIRTNKPNFEAIEEINFQILLNGYVQKDILIDNDKARVYYKEFLIDIVQYNKVLEKLEKEIDKYKKEHNKGEDFKT